VNVTQHKQWIATGKWRLVPGDISTLRNKKKQSVKFNLNEQIQLVEST